MSIVEKECKDFPKRIWEIGFFTLWFACTWEEIRQCLWMNYCIYTLWYKKYVEQRRNT